MALSVPMVIFGVVYAVSAAGDLRQLSAMSRSLVACLLLIGFSGMVISVSSIWLIARLYRDLRPLWIGGVASGMCGLGLAGGALARIIPCAGPT